MIVRLRICMVQDLLHLQDLGQGQHHILLCCDLANMHKISVYEKLQQFRSLKGNGFKVVDKVTRFQQGVNVSKESVQTIYFQTHGIAAADRRFWGWFPLRGVNIGEDFIVEL